MGSLCHCSLITTLINAKEINLLTKFCSLEMLPFPAVTTFQYELLATQKSFKVQNRLSKFYKPKPLVKNKCLGLTFIYNNN